VWLAVIGFSLALVDGERQRQPPFSIKRLSARLVLTPAPRQTSIIIIFFI
jgi:hypothetical protein